MTDFTQGRRKIPALFSVFKEGVRELTRRPARGGAAKAPRRRRTRVCPDLSSTSPSGTTVETTTRRPAELKKTRRPLIHAASKVERQSYLVRREFFVEAYHEASTELLRGGREVIFPCWSFPPGLPFVRSGPIFEAFWDGCVEKYQPAAVGFDSS